MERPLSMIGSNMATPTHKRNASSIRSIAKIQGSSMISSFITNLRLLNLDTLNDWPNISTLTLSSGSETKSRIKAVEWTLYHLFRLYDPQLTTEKLRPFFPPLEHMQSLNLRAALYRCIGELKKNGVLGREVVLRKTMLDDCTGDKFWELCLSFSAVVLRKLTLQQQERSHQPIAQKLGTANALSKKDRDSLLPLAIAHKSALSKVLADKHRRRESYVRFSTLLDDKEADLSRRHSMIGSSIPVVQNTDHLQRLFKIEEAVSSQWSSDADFKDAIIHGDPAAAGDHVLLQKPEEFLESIDQGEMTFDARRDSGVVEDIEIKAKTQNARVKDWQALHEQLQADQRYSVTSLDSSRDASQTSSELVFDQHQDLSMDDPLPPSQGRDTPEQVPSYVSKYDEILTSMREELRRAHSVKKANGGPVPLMPTRKPSITLDAVAGAPRPLSARSPSNRSISPTFPLRPGLNRRISSSSRSRSYQQPKVISQREPIPLKSEIFSPIKSTRSMSPASAASSRLQSPVEADEVLGIDTMTFAKSEDQDAVSTPATDSGVGFGLAPDAESWGRPSEETVKSRKRASTPRVVSFADQPNLSERTRQSMSAANSETFYIDDQSEKTEEGKDAMQRQRYPLSERTRQSISGLNFALPIRPTLSTTPSAGPNDTLSPLKTRINTNYASQATSQRDITPQERLFEADAEYSSVFRSRPKIATSPVLAPSSPMAGKDLSESSFLHE